jgi:hypothetical protein
MYDNGLSFLAEPVQEAAAYLDFRTHAIAPYSPHQNGKVERCHQTLSRLALSAVSSWDHGPRDAAGRLYDYTPISEHELIERVSTAVDTYNFARPHSALAGRTPWDAFAGDGTPLRIESPQRLRFALRHRKIQTVANKGVYKHRRWYRDDALDQRVGDQVIVAWLRKDERTVDVYDIDGRFLCTARPHGALSRDEIVAIKRRERERYAQQHRRLSSAITDAVESYAPTNAPGGLDVVSVLAEGQRAASREHERLIAALGLSGDVGRPWEPGDPPS